MGKVEFEFGTEGPKVRWNPFERARETIVPLLATLYRMLNIRADTAALAARNSPPHDEPLPSAKEREITAAHIGLGEHRIREAELAILAKGAELEALGVDITDSDLLEAKASARSRLDEIRTETAAAARPLLERRMKARENLSELEQINTASTLPTGRSAIEFIGSTLLTAIVEAVIGGLLFKEQVGYAPGIGLAFGIGCAFALAGSGLGIGWANLRRGSRARQFGGMALLFFFGAIALFLLFVIAHYRIALTSGSDNLAAATLSSIEAAPGSPFLDGSALTFIAINVGCIWLVAWEASRFLGWLDLRRLRIANERAEKAVVRCSADRLFDVETAKSDALDRGDEVVEEAGRNAIRGKVLHGECVAIVKEVGDDLKAIVRSHGICHQEYREVFAAVNRAKWQQKRFENPPPELDLVTPELPVGLHGISQALEARSVKVRDAQPAFKSEIYELADAARRDIDRLFSEIDHEVRFADRLRVVR